jgi:NAD(P)H-hydrate epimerase
MIVLSPEESRELDRRTIEAGTPSEVLMQRAAQGVFDFLRQRFDFSRNRFWVECGKGNNGEDGQIVARLLRQAGATLDQEAPSVIVDAVLGTGLRGPASGRALEQIRWIEGRPGAKVVAIDVPSGLGSGGEHVTADLTIAIGTLKPVHVLPPWCDACGEVQVIDIGLLPAESKLHQIDPPTFAPRRRDSHKGDYGHVLVIGGAPGKSGAAAMAGLAALRAGAGWVTVTAPAPYPELMTASLDTPPLEGKTVVAIGPGLGMGYAGMVRDLYANCPVPMIVDADALNSLAGWTLPSPPAPRILTPHPGEFRRLAPLDDRLTSSRAFAETNQVTVVLKGYRTIVAHPDGRAYVNPTGSPALAKAGSGDILTGLIAGLYAQDPREESVHAAVWLHGRCGELGEKRWTERCLIATDLLDFLPDAIRSAQ